VLIGTQVASVDLWTTPSVSHKVEVKNITEPTGPTTIYGFGNSTTYAYAATGSETTVTVRLTKSVVYGVLLINCLAINLPPGVPLSCEVWVDGAYRATIPAFTSGTIGLTPGDHEVYVFIAPRDYWYGDPIIRTVSISLGQTFTFSVTWFIQ